LCLVIECLITGPFYTIVDSSSIESFPVDTVLITTAYMLQWWETYYLPHMLLCCIWHIAVNCSSRLHL